MECEDYELMCCHVSNNITGDSDIQHDAGDESVSGGEDYGGHDADLGQYYL